MQSPARTLTSIACVAALCTGCKGEDVAGTGCSLPRFTSSAWAGTEGTPATFPAGTASTQEEPLDFDGKLGRIREGHKLLMSRYEHASTAAEREAVRQEARTFVIEAIVRDIFPEWMGTPWTMYAVKDGLEPDALVPHEEGKGVSCSYFITSVLANAGLLLESRRKFAGAIAIHIQRSLAPDQDDLHRYWNTTPEELEDKLVALGDGLYLVGLNCHIGFIVVDGGEARFVHSSYVEPYMVVDERLCTSQAIANSEGSGYVVTTLFEDERLIEHWLTGTEVPFQKF